MANNFAYPNSHFPHFKEKGGQIYGDVTVAGTVTASGFSGASATAGLALGSNVVILIGAASPTSGASGTGDNVAGPGSLYIATTAGELWIQTGLISSPDWVLVGDQTEA